MPATRTSVNTITFNGLEYTAVKEFRCAYLLPFSWFCCCRPDITVLKGGKIIGTVEMPCYPEFVCKLEVNCYKGESRDEASKLWTLKKCICNCHTMFGKQCGCCADCAKYMDIEISPGAAGQNAIHGKLQKEHFGCVNECYTMADKYNFDCPSQNPDENAIFIAAVQFIDMLYFENNYSLLYGHGGI